MTDVLDIDDLDPDELDAVLAEAAALKADVAANEPHAVLPERSLAMLFEQPSTRTRVSFEVGMTQLGGHAVFLGKEDIQLGRGEPIKDTARALARYVDAIMARVGDHDDLEALAEYADVPVVNGLSDEAHPAQTLADLLTVREQCGFDAEVAWVGDANNVGASFVVGAAMAGLDVSVATPEAYAFDESVFERAREYGAEPTVTHDPVEAVDDADVVYTDVWVSMADAENPEEKRETFYDGGFQVNEDLLAHGDDPAVMHCLPAHRGEEITDDVIESDAAIVWEQAENRMHAQKGLLVHLLNGD
ncbi:ornithine carbamoyltransferase [Halospeciosus flavus]|uniref:Ornithine carbamoyltransferase n=1 Tax=Halospeciosus flavus TaxID=3032283 RepID=A0ABD5Z749_9EURY|nr:ornithine carbamoyltransferase [Halospeciosus flavus]